MTNQFLCPNSLPDHEKCIPISQRCNGFNDCGDESDETQDCIVDCELDEWKLKTWKKLESGVWKEYDCSEDCGGGVREYTRTIKREAENGGTPCTGGSNRTEPCNIQPCPCNIWCCKRKLNIVEYKESKGKTASSINNFIFSRL